MDLVSELWVEIERGKLCAGTMSAPRKKDEEGLLKIVIRPISVKGQLMYQVSEHFKKKVNHRNLIPSECLIFIQGHLHDGFKQGVFSTEVAIYHALVNKQKNISISKKASERPLNITHNRSKKYILKEGSPIPFLIASGIMTEEGKVIAKKYDKFRQINRFLEMAQDIIDHLPQEGVIEVIDFGCGKAYLTFALYHYLHHILKREVNMLGLDLKQDVIEDCQEIAEKLGYASLKFEVGDINQQKLKKKINLVISLHACDTATDAAIEKAIHWDSDVILCVPCCQHELYGQIRNEALSSLLRHGILRERMAALITDAARAELMTALGYDVQVLEFIEMEHTPKNLLLRAVKAPSKIKSRHAYERYRQFKQEMHIFPSLEARFEKELDNCQDF